MLIYKGSHGVYRVSGFAVVLATATVDTGCASLRPHDNRTASIRAPSFQSLHSSHLSFELSLQWPLIPGLPLSMFWPVCNPCRHSQPWAFQKPTPVRLCLSRLEMRQQSCRLQACRTPSLLTKPCFSLLRRVPLLTQTLLQLLHWGCRRGPNILEVVGGGGGYFALHHSGLGLRVSGVPYF